MSLTVKFWGTRGSIPSPRPAGEGRDALARILAAAQPSDLADRSAIEAFIDAGCRGEMPTQYGGDTSCVEIAGSDGARLIIDLGSGARALGRDLMAREGAVLDGPLHILLSHLHWDHIQGFPFFGPAFTPGNRLHVYGCHAGIDAALRRQNSAPFFPVPFAALGAEISFEALTAAATAEIAGFSVTPFLLPHAGDAYAYRIERSGLTVVYATDGEHKPEAIGAEYPFVAFAKGADLLIFDAQYSLAETVSIKEDWGHSSNVVGVELALFAGVRRLLFFHHDPLSSDAQLDQMVESSRQLEEIMREGRPDVAIDAAWDGLEIELS